MLKITGSETGALNKFYFISDNPKIFVSRKATVQWLELHPIYSTI
jgi:hypothetical protein